MKKSEDESIRHTTIVPQTFHVSRKRFELKVIIEALFLPIGNEDYVATHVYIEDCSLHKNQYTCGFVIITNAFL